MNTEHLTEAERDLLAKAQAALGCRHECDGIYILGRFYNAANSDAIIDLLTRLAEAQEAAQRWADKAMELAAKGTVRNG